VVLALGPIFNSEDPRRLSQAFGEASVIARKLRDRRSSPPSALQAMWLSAVPGINGLRPRDAGYPTVSVVIPAKNEANNLPFVISRIPTWVHEVILVDGNSTDGTVNVARGCMPAIRVVTQSAHGKGDALRRGFAAVTGDIIVTLDADGSTDPSEIPAFVGALLGGADFAKGSRFVEGGGSSDITSVRKFGNWGLTTLVRLLFGHRFRDLCYGYNAFWTRLVPNLALDRDGFEIETLMNLRALRVGLKMVEVASFESPRLSGTSALRPFPDGWRVLNIIARERFSRRIRAQLPRRSLPAHPAAPDVASVDPVSQPEPEVVILCGGHGTRLSLGPVTELMPKPIVKVAGRPILHRIMDHYSSHGFNKFTLCLGYGGDVIRDYFLNYQLRHQNFSLHLTSGGLLLLDGQAEMPNWRVKCVETGYTTQTGARICRAMKYLETPYFLCTYGDGLSDVDLKALLAFHRSHGRIATLTAVRSPLPATSSTGRFGELVLDDGDRVVSFTEKPDHPSSHASGYVNGGFFVFNREILKYLSEDDFCILERSPLERLAAEDELRAFRHDGFWRCMDTLEDRDNLDRLLTGPLQANGNGELPPDGAPE
jgi:glucose-1-phosphate cytidylyltransferase